MALDEKWNCKFEFITDIYFDVLHSIIYAFLRVYGPEYRDELIYDAAEDEQVYFNLNDSALIYFLDPEGKTRKISLIGSFSFQDEIIDRNVPIVDLLYSNLNDYTKFIQISISRHNEFCYSLDFGSFGYDFYFSEYALFDIAYKLANHLLSVINRKATIQIMNPDEFEKNKEYFKKLNRIKEQYTTSSYDDVKVKEVERNEPNLRTQMRFEIFQEIKLEHPEWTQEKVALEARALLEEDISTETVRNTYRLMGVKWKRGDRTR